MTVNNEQITELIAEPMQAGGRRHPSRLLVLGRAACGIHELFPQDDLKLSAGGRIPGPIALPGGDWVKGVAAGAGRRGNRLARQAQGADGGDVVTNDPWTDLQIRPGQATINAGEALKYEVTAMKGGLLRVLGPEQGVQLAVGDANVAQVLDERTSAASRRAARPWWPGWARSPPRPPWTWPPATAIATGVDRRRGIIVHATGGHYPQRRRHLYLPRSRETRAGGEGGEHRADRARRGPPGGRPRSARALGWRNGQAGQCAASIRAAASPRSRSSTR